MRDAIRRMTRESDPRSARSDPVAGSSSFGTFPPRPIVEESNVANDGHTSASGSVRLSLSYDYRCRRTRRTYRFTIR